MNRRRRMLEASAHPVVRAYDDFHEWVLGLPWTVERTDAVGRPGVRCFGIDCEPLERRQLWLLTGLFRELDPSGAGLAVIVPSEAAAPIEAAGWGRVFAPMPGGHVLVTVSEDARRRREDLEALVLAAYGLAML
jgi:hypothetical protein